MIKFAVLLSVFLCGCVQASVEDDIVVTNKVVLFDGALPTTSFTSPKLTLTADKDFDVSNDVKKLKDKKFGLSCTVELSDASVFVNEGSLMNIDEVQVLVKGKNNSITVFDHTVSSAEKATGNMHVMPSVDDVRLQKLLEAGQANVSVLVTGEATPDFPRTVTATLKLHAVVNMDKSWM